MSDTLVSGSPENESLIRKVVGVVGFISCSRRGTDSSSPARASKLSQTTFKNLKSIYQNAVLLTYTNI